MVPSSKAFAGFSHEIFTGKLMKYGLNENPLRYSEAARLSAGQLAVCDLTLTRGIAQNDLQKSLPNLNILVFL